MKHKTLKLKYEKKLQTSSFKLQEQGFTLVELIVVVAIVAIAGLVLVDMFIGQNRLYRTQTAELTVTNDARMALDELDSYVRQANRTLASFTGFDAGPQTLILQIQSYNSSNQLIPGAFDRVVFYMDGSNFMRQVFPDSSSARGGGTKKLAGNVTGLAISYNSADYATVTEVSIDLTIQEPAGIQSRTITVSSNSKLRNY